jgi:hypothetical protein
MIVIIASRYDEAAERLAARWSVLGARLLTCEDLSTVGWRYDPSRPRDGTAVVGGRGVAVGEIRGVLTRLPCVSEFELVQITTGDRAYVAAEMTAFLTCWLSTLPCPVLNQPTPVCLAGPNLFPGQWAAAAVGQGLRAQRRPHEASPDVEVTVTVTVVGDRAFGEADEALRLGACRLAKAAGVDLLGVYFSGADPTFAGVSLTPSLDPPEVADAVRDYFERPPLSRRSAIASPISRPVADW